MCVVIDSQVRLLAEKEKVGDDEGSTGSVLIHLRFFRDKEAAEKLGLPPLQEKQLRDSDESATETGQIFIIF
jgi:hypothetical protein